MSDEEIRKHQKAAAVAYDQEKDSAPVVVAKGKGYVADRIIEVWVDKILEGQFPFLQEGVNTVDGKVADKTITDTLEGWSAAVDVSGLTDDIEEELA